MRTRNHRACNLALNLSRCWSSRRGFFPLAARAGGFFAVTSRVSSSGVIPPRWFFAVLISAPAVSRAFSPSRFSRFPSRASRGSRLSRFALSISRLPFRSASLLAFRFRHNRAGLVFRAFPFFAFPAFLFSGFALSRVSSFRVSPSRPHFPRLSFIASAFSRLSRFALSRASNYRAFLFVPLRFSRSGSGITALVWFFALFPFSRFPLFSFPVSRFSFRGSGAGAVLALVAVAFLSSRFRLWRLKSVNKYVRNFSQFAKHRFLWRLNTSQFLPRFVGFRGSYIARPSFSRRQSPRFSLIASAFSRLSRFALSRASSFRGSRFSPLRFSRFGSCFAAAGQFSALSSLSLFFLLALSPSRFSFRVHGSGTYSALVAGTFSASCPVFTLGFSRVSSIRKSPQFVSPSFLWASVNRRSLNHSVGFGVMCNPARTPPQGYPALHSRILDTQP